MNFVHTKNKGTALLVAIILVPILLILAVALIDPITRSYRAAAADQKRLLAKSIADNLFEQALLATKDLPTGSNSHGCLTASGAGTVTQGGATAPCTEEVDFGYGKATGRWEVFGQPQTDEEHLIDNMYYTVPSVGSGDAGSEYCSTENPVKDDGTLNDALANLGLGSTNFTGGLTASDWPCNWGKIREGDFITIPLYLEQDGVVYNPPDLGLSEFQLRIRPACNPDATGRTDAYVGQICGNSERYSLEAGQGEVAKDTIIVLWEISGKDTDENGTNVYLTHTYQGFAKDSRFNILSVNNFLTGPNQSIPLFQNSWVLKNDGGKNSLSSQLLTIYKPVLKFQVIHTLNSSTGKIPYLEYQFKAPYINGKPPISNSSKIVKIEVMVDGGYSETIEKTIGLPKPVTGFVIQQ